MQVSVVIPVYNAVNYIVTAVQSALEQSEVVEVVLVEDGSKDGGLEICIRLADENESVRLIRHPNGENRGAGASRNLGIVSARYDYIAFLDADDYYLPERFARANEILADDSEVDGVYEAIGACFESEAARERYFSRFNSELTTVSRPVAPEKLFEALVLGGKGYFHCNGLVVKKTLFEKTGFFPEHLSLSQDFAMWVKMAAKGSLVAGSLDKAVAVRRVHDANRTLASQRRYLFFAMLCWKTLWSWSIEEGLRPSRQLAILFNLVNSRLKLDQKLPSGHQSIRKFALFAKYIGREPHLLLSPFLYNHTVRSTLKRVLFRLRSGA